MTKEQAEEIVLSILELRKQGFTENKDFYKPMWEKYCLSEHETEWALEMVSTGAFRAGLISSGKIIPPILYQPIEDPIFKTAFKLAWIDFKGEKHYIKYWKNKNKKKSWLANLLQRLKN
jgi:hypothetical protein